MAAKIQNTSLSGALMLVCITTGTLLLGVQWRRLPAVPAPKFEFPKFPDVVSPKPSTGASPNAEKIDAKLIVDLSDRKVQLYKNEKLKASYVIAIGQEGWETPMGSFHVFQMVENPTWQHPITGETVPPGKDNPLGKRWIGFTAQGKLLIGFHGTTDYSLLGQAVSHGCLRMKNADVSALYQQVQIGTPVIVKP